MDFLRRLYRERRLSDSELAGRLRALDALAAGKLRPNLLTGKEVQEVKEVKKAKEVKEAQEVGKW